MHTTLAINETAKGGVDKVKRYNWAVKDEPGTFTLINKGMLNIPPEYQRSHDSELKILAISSKWSWVALGTLIVCRRQDGRHYVIDGGHRLLAAMKRSDVTSLPCMVFELDTTQQEAEAFLRANRNRKPMTTRQAFKALLHSGDVDAQFVQELCDQVGRKIDFGTSGSSFASVHQLMRMADADKAAARRVFMTAHRICIGTLISQEMLRGLFLIETKLNDGRSVSDAYITKRLCSLGNDEILKSIRAAKGFLAETGARPCAIGIQNIYNKGLRSNKIEVIQ